jgi:hypothetical protein
MPMRVLTAIAAGQASADIPPFIRTWYRDYDYLYVLGPHVVNPLPNLLEELDSSARFVLYKIRRAPEPSSAGSGENGAKPSRP